MPATLTDDALSRAKARLADGTLTEADLDAIAGAAPRGRMLRQKLLYIHASHPTIRAEAINVSLHEPLAGSVTQLDPLAEPSPYKCVFDAILDGWRVIHFPQQRAAFDDREIDILGYEFILEKIAAYENT